MPVGGRPASRRAFSRSASASSTSLRAASRSFSDLAVWNFLIAVFRAHCSASDSATSATRYLPVTEPNGCASFGVTMSMNSRCVMPPYGVGPNQNFSEQVLERRLAPEHFEPEDRMLLLQL